MGIFEECSEAALLALRSGSTQREREKREDCLFAIIV
jgi:hypothetical protein